MAKQRRRALNSPVVQLLRQPPQRPKRHQRQRRPLLRRNLMLPKKPGSLRKRRHRWLRRYVNRPINANHAMLNPSAVVAMERRPHTARTEKVAACKTASAVARIILHQPEDPPLRDAHANTHRMVVVQTTKLQHAVTTTMAAAASTPLMVAVSTKSHQHKVHVTKDAHAIHSNSVAAPMASPFRQDLTTMAATAHRPNSNVAQTASHRPKDRTQRVAHALKANTVAAWTASHQPRDRGMKVAIVFQPRHRRRVALRRTEETAPATRLSTSSMLSMVAAPASGTAAVAAMTIASKLLKIARVFARSQLARALAHCPKSMDHAPDIIQCTTMILIATLARSLFSAAAWATTIASKRLRHARNSVLSMNHCVGVKFYILTK